VTRYTPSMEVNHLQTGQKVEFGSFW